MALLLASLLLLSTDLLFVCYHLVLLECPLSATNLVARDGHLMSGCFFLRLIYCYAKAVAFKKLATEIRRQPIKCLPLCYLLLWENPTQPYFIDLHPYLRVAVTA